MIINHDSFIIIEKQKNKRMKTIKIDLKVILLVFLLLPAISCNKDHLEIEPLGSISRSTLANENGANKLLIGVYALVDGAGAAGGGAQASDAYIFGADENRRGTEAGVSILDAFQWNPTDPYFSNKWIFQYAAIGRANDVLRILPEVKNSTPDKLTQIEAEARFLRAMFYLKLAFYFKNVPWIDESVTYSNQNYLVPNTVNILPKIEADFQFAANNLSEIKADVGRANKWAAKAFLAKTYLYQRKYIEAKIVLDDIIASGKTPRGLKYALLPKYNDNFITSTKHGSEGVFVMQNSVKDGQSIDARGNSMDKYAGTYNSPANAGGAGWLQPTFDLVDAFQTHATTGLPLLDTYQNTPVPTGRKIPSRLIQELLIRVLTGVWADGEFHIATGVFTREEHGSVIIEMQALTLLLKIRQRKKTRLRSREYSERRAIPIILFVLPMYCYGQRSVKLRSALCRKRRIMSI